MTFHRWFLTAIALFGCAASAAGAASLPENDSDGDGLSDRFEQRLLDRFSPRFFLSADDCSVKPARFAPSSLIPVPSADDGTIYGQVSPAQASSGPGRAIELHFYHLWRIDCGRMGHALDAEHVSVLLRGSGESADGWKAVYWYAAAHEDTVCDAGQLTRASALNAETHGADVWVSSGKHASFLSDQLCRHGCGGDRCANSTPLPLKSPVNVGEWDSPMNGAAWIASPVWPLAAKMRRSDFTEARLASLEHLPENGVAWANPSRRPVQTAILGGNAGVSGAAKGGMAGAQAALIGNRQTGSALDTAAGNTTEAIGTAARNTGGALGKSFRRVRKALDAAGSQTTRALRPN